MQKIIKPIKAFFIAPLVAPIVYFIGSLILGGSEQINSFKDFYMIALMFFYFAIPVSYAVTAILGMPIYFILMQFKCLSLTSLSLSGMLLGSAVVIFALSAIVGFRDDYTVQEYVWFFFIGAGLGLSVSYTFARIAGLSRRL
ncbi:hypothetical protein [sulfur-oxidizing endosymbiont of Gigantopelta aegis]|uniref:hypothetical protein n=1 Tax=sulfur-oxidizing endosymbiont of Gigantopelta aegis TaxID=2794934 RepID=UPI0018DEA492|nr:hypothetical protein [sulfur-oxidizing endosymbiont of Gigantopelta aegis]